tara:strand:+ start:3386 stop:3697 length:312 start_codon:yes stop_codon:yes gene_type:complete
MKRIFVKNDFLPTGYLCQIGGSFESYSNWAYSQGVVKDLEFDDSFLGACWKSGPHILIYVSKKCNSIIAHEIHHAVIKTQQHTSCYDEEFGAMCTQFLASKLL